MSTAMGRAPAQTARARTCDPGHFGTRARANSAAHFEAAWGWPAVGVDQFVFGHRSAQHAPSGQPPTPLTAETLTTRAGPIGEDHPGRVALAARSSPTLGGVTVHGRGVAA